MHLRSTTLGLKGLYWKRRVSYLVRGVRPRQVTTYLTLAELTKRYESRWTPEHLTSAELKVFSQNGEDGVLCALLNALGPGTNTFVEFGIGPGLEGNCVFLSDVLGWAGLFIEAHQPSYERLAFKYRANPHVRCRRDMVTPTNLDDLAISSGLPSELDILSIDIDGQDIWVWEGVQRLSPRVVIVEYNGDLPLDESLAQPRDWSRHWRLDNVYGASLQALCDLGKLKGYRLVHTELVGSNAFFVRDDLAPAVERWSSEPARRVSNQFLVGGRHTP
jgi:hypothetical protein